MMIGNKNGQRERVWRQIGMAKKEANRERTEERAKKR